MGYEKDELAAIGERFHTDSLLEWSEKVVQAARQDLPRLKTRGITEQTLKDIEASRKDVEKLNLAQEREKKDLPALAVARHKATKSALDWREEVKGLAEATFDSEPDVLVRFRTGAKSSHSLPKIIAEIGFQLGAVREHLGALKGVGVTEAFVKRGEEILGQLKEIQGRQADEQAQTAPGTFKLYVAEGILYTRGRFVTRIAGVEFRTDEAWLSRYSYAPLRRQEAAAQGRRGRSAKATATAE